VNEMPGFDGTGPRGEGSMTGGRRGYCAVPNPRVPYGGRGVGVGRGAFGGGRGFRNRFYAIGQPGLAVDPEPLRNVTPPDSNKEILSKLDNIDERINKLEENYKK